MFRTLRLDLVLVQAVIAGALSFAHLHDLAVAAGQDGWKAWAYPVSVDLLLVAAWRRIRTGADNRDAWLWFAIALIASLGANVATAGLLDMQHVPPWLRILVAGWPALSFLGGTLLAHAPTTATVPEPMPKPGEDPDAESALSLRVEREPAPAPELPPAETVVEDVPPEAAPSTPAVPVPPALLDHARKIAAVHQAQTGTPIDGATLRNRLGVPAALADSIALQLT
ncbi:DUF2637 domain-containing protein [Streptomyces sp. NPDC101118]|uniref:DUF2637 domain-containing protein n=1 Tax=Streptomyces sp. NPDC101118 TaxID=3366109 RepID=UPI0037F58CDD